MTRAHALDDDPELEANEGGLYFAAAGLVWLLRALLLVELGFSATEAANRVTGHRQFQWAAGQLREIVDGWPEATGEGRVCPFRIHQAIARHETAEGTEAVDRADA